MRRPSPLQTPCVHQDILNRIFHSNLGMRPVSDRLTLATFPYFREKNKTKHCKVWQRAIAALSGAGPLSNKSWEGRTPARRHRCGKSLELLVPLSPSPLAQIRLEPPQEKQAGHPSPRCREFIPEMPVFPSAGCPPSPGSRVPAPAAAWLPHLLRTQRGFPQRAQTWPEPHFPEARMGRFLGDPAHLAQPLPTPGARAPRQAEEAAGAPLPPRPTLPRGLPAERGAGLSRREDGEGPLHPRGAPSPQAMLAPPAEPSARRSPAGSPPPLLRTAPPATGTLFKLQPSREAP